MEYNYFKNTWWWGQSITIVRCDGKAMVSLSVFNEYTSNCGYVNELIVHESIRRKGVGRAMMQEVERQARMMGLDYIYLGARKTSFVAGWYMRLGYYVSENCTEECPELLFTMIKDLK